ncbi:uncharacterized protein MELLADRAFT_92104 [Melampsora larici-populina 98AG31]|uniref:Uncharacterized protein n=1 Tax=Melampsora larici-populina (strain 98AG31 / pathotype 3-4-7) TaxID=747676 RepID=F4S1I5_MELLP|nr:uncharacterized protein MELLADRAFT_92104 [Melampsora larici-populina 98AG31]EGG01499.1 hypothetical protein MELLADRAFT_92104 [Melampsora larici-populina 98AG31]
MCDLSILLSAIHIQLYNKILIQILFNHVNTPPSSQLVADQQSECCQCVACSVKSCTPTASYANPGQVRLRPAWQRPRRSEACDVVWIRATRLQRCQHVESEKLPNPSSAHQLTRGRCTPVSPPCQGRHPQLATPLPPLSFWNVGSKGTKLPPTPNRIQPGLDGSLPTGPGAVWAPIGRMFLSREGPLYKYAHNTLHPPWRSAADYNSIFDWRTVRVISDYNAAGSFNGACNTAQSMNGSDHRSDPLPWCRDGLNPANKAAALARYNVKALRQVCPDLTSGEDKCLCHLLADSDDDPVTPGPSGQLDSSPTPTQPAVTMSTHNPLIRKDSPVKLRRDLSNSSFTKTQLNEDANSFTSCEEDIDGLDSGKGLLAQSGRPQTKGLPSASKYSAAPCSPRASNLIRGSNSSDQLPS